MDILEYRGKEILRRYGVATPAGFACLTADDAVEAAGKLGGQKWAVKAQIHAGGRGKAGGVRIAHSQEELRKIARGLLGSALVTEQTRPAGAIVTRLLVEAAADIEKEFYVGMTIDRSSQLVTLIASSEGGMEMEELAARMPERLVRVAIDPAAGLTDGQADEVARKLGIREINLPAARACMQGLYNAFDRCDATLAEINPLALTGDGELIALDAKFRFDENALFRHPEIRELTDVDQADAAAREAAAHGLAYVPLEGNIGCMANGAGLAMATMDAIQLVGGAPANFLDIGSAKADNMTAALRILLRHPGLKAILVNICGGALRCDLIAQGLAEAIRQADPGMPVVVRITGTNERAGRKILLESGLAVLVATNIDDAAQKAVHAAKGG